MKWAAVVLLVATAAVGFSLRPEVARSPTMWLGLCVPYTLLAALAVHRLYDDGILLDTIKFRGGDVTLGVIIAAILLAGAWVTRRLLLPQGAEEVAWLYRVLLQIGTTQGSPGVFGLLIWLALCEELAWRGLVLRAMNERFGSRVGWPVATGAYAAAHLPTVVTLSDSAAGPNPLIVLAALGCGSFWSFAATQTGRLPPVIVSHFVFSSFAPMLLSPGFSFG
jgi:membrane protease YdiL (CAAX protease family)